MPLASTQHIRSQFPALRRIHGSQPAAYFDGPGGTQVPEPVPLAMANYLFHQNANAHWAFPTSAETDRVRHQAREAMADFLGGAAHEIVFGPNMTTLTYQLSRTLGRAMDPGDEIIVTELDHHANIDPWMALERERGVRIKVLPMDSATGTLCLEEFPDLVTVRTRLLAIGAASNALGTLTDIAPMVRLARDAGARVFVDAVHLAPHRSISVRRLGCDFLACSPYKFYGPHMGVLWMRSEVLEALEVPKVAPAPNQGPERFESGTVNAEGMAGTTATVNFLAGLAEGVNPVVSSEESVNPVVSSGEGVDPGTLLEEAGDPDRRARLEAFFSGLTLREGALFERLWVGLETIPGVRLLGPHPTPDRAPTLSFVVRDLPAREVSSRLANEAGSFLSHGDFYASTAVERLGLKNQGLVRAGISLYNTAEEVDRLVEGVERIAASS